MSYKITKKKIKKIKKSNINKIIKKTKFKGGGIGIDNHNKQDKCPNNNQGSIFCLNYFKNLNKQHSIVKKNNKINPKIINSIIPRNKNIPSNHNLQNLHLSNPLPVNTGYIGVIPY